jgi:coenzyme F420-reducing hydrogenase delta subunit
LDPEILVFSCNWDGWSCIESAVNAGLKYPASVKVVKVNCLSRIHAGLILQALDLGADGVMLLGCEPGKCHFGSDSDCVTREYEKVQSLLELLGMYKGRLVLVRLPAFDGSKFVRKVTRLIDDIKQVPHLNQSKETVTHSAENIKV